MTDDRKTDLDPSTAESADPPAEEAKARPGATVIEDASTEEAPKAVFAGAAAPAGAPGAGKTQVPEAQEKPKVTRTLDDEPPRKTVAATPATHTRRSSGNGALILGGVAVLAIGALVTLIYVTSKPTSEVTTAKASHPTSGAPSSHPTTTQAATAPEQPADTPPSPNAANPPPTPAQPPTPGQTPPHPPAPGTPPSIPNLLPSVLPSVLPPFPTALPNVLPSGFPPLPSALPPP